MEVNGQLHARTTLHRKTASPIPVAAGLGALEEIKISYICQEQNHVSSVRIGSVDVFRMKLKNSCICFIYTIAHYKNHAVFIFYFNLLKPTGYVMHQQFNTQQLYVLPTLYLCVLYLSENKQRLVPLTA